MNYRSPRCVWSCAVRAGLMLGFGAWACDFAAADEPPASDRKIDFVRDVRPILSIHCRRCHGPDKQRSGLRLDQKAAALKGGDRGPVILPGKSTSSLILERVSDSSPESRMPPEGQPLSREQIVVLRAWIDQGAAWPDDGSSAEISTDWWSLRPLVSPAMPDAMADNAIDRFVRAKLAEHQMTAAPEAPPRTLIRRLSFDLVGLPPTPEEIDAFEQSAVRNPQSNASLTGCWHPRATANAGPGIGWTWPTSPRRTGTIRTAFARTPGHIEII